MYRPVGPKPVPVISTSVPPVVVTRTEPLELDPITGGTDAGTLNPETVTVLTWVRTTVMTRVEVSGVSGSESMHATVSAYVGESQYDSPLESGATEILPETASIEKRADP